MAYTLDQIKQFAQNPGSIPGGGTYGEGSVFNIASMIGSLKQAIQSGQLNISDYLNIADPLIKSAAQTTQSIAGKGSKAANAVNPGFAQLQSLGAVNSSNGQYGAAAPFTAREYANLPENVLPTQKEVNSGQIPLTLLPPIQRFRPDSSTSPTGQPLPQINPGPAGLQPATTPTVGAPLTSTPDPNNPGQSIGIPVVGDPLQNSVPKVIDQSVIEQEGIRQQEQQRQALAAQDAIRAGRLNDLKTLLSQQEDRQFSENAPGIYEDLNSRGLIQSSGLGEALAREKAKLAANTNDQLTQQGLADRDADVSGIGDILSKLQSFQTSGLERKFTLQDFQNEADLAQKLGATNAPTIAGGKSVLSGVLSGALNGAGTGAVVGKGNPYAIGAGAVAGGAAGGTKGK